MSDNLYWTTNTLSSVTFDVLKDNSDVIEDPLIDANKLATLDLEECYFESAVKFITESNKEFSDSKINLYNKILESSSVAVIHESFSDFFVKVKEIIVKFLKFLKSLFQRFLTQLSRLIGSDKYLEKHKKDFDKFKDGDKFDQDGFKYTFDERVPIPDALLNYDTSLFSTDLLSDNNINIDATYVANKKKALENSLDEYYDIFRAKVLNKDEKNKIYQSDFSDELFKIYRDGETTTDKLEIDRTYIREVVDRFFKYKKTEASVNKQYKAVETAYKKVEDQVKDLVKRNGDLSYQAFINKLPNGTNGNNITSFANSDDVNINISDTTNMGKSMASDVLTQLDLYAKVKADQVQECSNIHTLAFAAKLDALKECAKQDQQTLYIALSRIQRTDAKREKEDY